jgi:putative endonuclease
MPPIDRRGGIIPERPATEPSEAGEARRRIAFRFGLSAESRAAAYLVAEGYRILGRRFRTPVGEIDIVARRRGVLIFVEVKARESFDAAAEAIGPRQRELLCLKDVKRQILKWRPQHRNSQIKDLGSPQSVPRIFHHAVRPQKTPRGSLRIALACLGRPSPIGRISDPLRASRLVSDRIDRPPWRLTPSETPRYGHPTAMRGHPRPSEERALSVVGRHLRGGCRGIRSHPSPLTEFGQQRTLSCGTHANALQELVIRKRPTWRRPMKSWKISPGRS